MGDFYYDNKKFGKSKDNKKSINTVVSNKESQLSNKNNSANVVSISLGKSDHIKLDIKKKKE